MESISTGLEVIALFGKLGLLKKLRLYIFLAAQQPSGRCNPTDQKFPCHPRSSITDFTLGIVLANTQHTEIPSEDSVHIWF